MAWRVEVSEAARKQIGALARQTAEQILRFLNDRVARLDDPRSLGEALRGPVPGSLWKYRLGDYRIIDDIQDHALVILVVRIGDRKDVYRRCSESRANSRRHDVRTSRPHGHSPVRP